MKFRYLTFLLLLLVFVVGIGAISAEDISDIGEISSDEVADEVISVDDTVTDVSTSEADEVTSDVEPTRSTTYTWGDFKSEVEDTSVSTVKLNQSNIAPSSDSSDQISINHDITIVGGYGYYIGNADWNSATSYNYIPMITSGNNLNVNFENVTFQYLSNNIFIKLMGNGNYAFKNCVFNNINCTGDHQSVIWLNYGYALIENCTFTNVTSSFGAVTNYYTSWGTAVNNARMTVRDSTFKDNYATTEPGAINNCGKLEVYDSTFENNAAFWWAGAIHTHSNANTTIVRSNFRNNTAGWNGGALYTYSYLTVINSTFEENIATTNTGGGAIGASSYMSRPTLVVENSVFNDNTALTGNGGAIVISSGTLTVTGSEFNNNIAPQLNGGAISSGSCTATVTDSIFKYNSAINGNGGAIYGTGNGRLTVNRCLFVNNTAKDDNSGHAIAYYYSGKSSTAAYLTYINNIFYGPNNGNGSVYAANNYLNIVHYNNTIEDISNYTEPEENGTNGSSTGNAVIPNNKKIDEYNWNILLNSTLTGTPVISGNYILVPATHTLYCYNTVDQSLVWNFTSEHGYFYELVVEDNKVYAPASWDALFIFYLNNGSLVTYNNLPQASSRYAPLIYNGIIYVSSDYGYGDNSNMWIAMINNTDYSYEGSILEINGIAYGDQALLSQPYIYGNNLYVNTVNGLMSYNLISGSTNSISGTVGNPIIDANGNICILSNNGNNLLLLDSNLNEISSVALDGACGMLVSDGSGNVYTVDENGYIYYACYTSSSLSCSKTTFHINPITSAMTCYNGKLYIGDNNGILWAFNAANLNRNLKNSLAWGFDTGSAITGGIIVDNGIIYVGNDDGYIYALNC